jgi:Aspartyl/Asparaginyl beta-hydroxylase
MNLSLARTIANLVYPIAGIKIDPDRLLKDLNQMKRHLWTRQDRYGPDVKHWHGICLYSISGRTNDLRTADRLPVYKTPAGEKCPYVCNEVLPQFKAPCLRGVLYRLKAGAKIGEYRDYGENRFTAGNVRVHIPVVTNDKIVMFVERKPYHFPAGTAWYFDASSRHSVENNSRVDRIHLVVDFKSCDGIESLLKPVTLNDQFRFLFHSLSYYFELVKTFIKFLPTREGRAEREQPKFFDIGFSSCIRHWGIICAASLD